jgi:ribulose-5-phosphate 4-epimerase/fuculose-1-phosphate aldolase
MVNHGVLIIGRDIHEAYFRAAVVEWRCRQAWHVEALGSGVPMDDKVVKTFGAQIAKSVASGNFDNWFAAAARRIVRHDPAVLD